jgi:hypothetical protein
MQDTLQYKGELIRISTSQTAQDVRRRRLGRKIRKIDKFLKSEPGFPVFRQAIPAIYWPALGWLEWHFAFFATV